MSGRKVKVVLELTEGDRPNQWSATGQVLILEGEKVTHALEFDKDQREYSPGSYLIKSFHFISDKV